LCFYILEICEIAQLNYKEGYYLSLIDKEYILNVSPVLPYFRGVKRKKRSDCISFTEDEWTFIKENYTKMYHKDIAKELGVSIKTFVDKTKEYRDNNKEKIKIEQIEFKYKKCHVVTSETKKQLREAASKYHETKTKGKKLSRVQVIEIKNNKNTQYTELAKIYNVSITTISEIKSGRTWKSINSLTNNSSDIINS
jgi:DNA-binding XRE family transcriptional regulator